MLFLNLTSAAAGLSFLLYVLSIGEKRNIIGLNFRTFLQQFDFMLIDIPALERKCAHEENTTGGGRYPPE